MGGVVWSPLGSYGTTGLAGDERLSVRIMRAPSHTPTTEPGVEMIVPPVLVAQNFTSKSEVESRKAGAGGRAGPIGMRCLVRVGLFYSGDPDLWAACGSRVGWCESGSGTCPAPGPCTKGPISHALSMAAYSSRFSRSWGSLSVKACQCPAAGAIADPRLPLAMRPS